MSPLLLCICTLGKSALASTTVSTSVGVRGAHITLGRGKVRTTLGLPGTGLSYTDEQRLGTAPTSAPANRWRFWRVVGFLLLLMGAASLMGSLFKH